MSKFEIDITKDVMKQIADENIQMKPKWQFELKSISFKLMATLAVLALIVLPTGISQVLQKQTYSEFLDYDGGLNVFIKTLPWFGIIAVIISLFIFFKSFNSKDIKLGNKVMPATLVALLIFVGVLGIGSTLPSGSTSDLLASISHIGSDEQVKTSGQVTELGDDYLKIQTDNGLIKVHYETLDEELNIGDKITVLGTKSDDSINAFVINIVEKAPNEEVKAIVVEPKPKKKKVAQKDPEPEIIETTPTETVKPTETQPVKKKTETKTEPKPEPVPTDAIYINGVYGYPDGGPYTKYKIFWKANFDLGLGYKAVYSLSPNPTYPGDAYVYNGSFIAANTETTTIITPTLGPGTYYVRICEYKGGSCGVYSSQFTIVFP